LVQRSRLAGEPVHNASTQIGHFVMAITGRWLPLILKRASASRPSGQRSDEDYDVLADGKVVGRTL
jgi:hypothetical protein